MTLRPHRHQKIAAAKAGFSTSTGGQLDRDSRLRSDKWRPVVMSAASPLH